MIHLTLAVQNPLQILNSNQPESRVEQLENQITELAAHIHAATFRLLELIREFDDCEGWAGPGMRSCAHWLNWKCGINIGAAREKVRVAHALQELPGISERFRRGEVSYSKVRAMTRVATPGNEDDLLMIARYGTAAHVERLVRNFRKVKRLEALERDKRHHELRELAWHEDDDGCWVLKGRLPPELGALVQKALESAMEDLREEHQDVSAETPDDGISSRPASVATRRADALVRMAEGFMSGSGSMCGGDQYQVHVHTDAATLAEDGSGAESELEDGGCVSAETSRRISCDAGVVHWLDNDKGEPLGVGRKTRTIPPAIRRALRRRDQGCRFPGCSCTRFVDAHHIRHWADGGETNLDNLVLLCRHHHRLVHEGGFGVQIGASRQVAFTNTQGQCIPDNGERRFRGNVFALAAANHKSGLNITPETGKCRWRGERMDDDLAITGLLQRE